jgi:hypothetical protein
LSTTGEEPPSVFAPKAKIFCPSVYSQATWTVPSETVSQNKFFFKLFILGILVIAMGKVDNTGDNYGGRYRISTFTKVIPDQRTLY